MFVVVFSSQKPCKIMKSSWFLVRIQVFVTAAFNIYMIGPFLWVLQVSSWIKMYMSRNDKNVMTSTNFDKTLKAISLFCLENKGFNIKFYACAYVYLFLKYIYKHFLMAQLECRRWSTTLVSSFTNSQCHQYNN